MRVNSTSTVVQVPGTGTPNSESLRTCTGFAGVFGSTPVLGVLQ